MKALAFEGVVFAFDAINCKVKTLLLIINFKYCI
jgi:hypothetical protein